MIGFPIIRNAVKRLYSRLDRPDARRNHLYLQPLRDFSGLDCPPLDQLREFAAAFLELEVKLLPAFDLARNGIVNRDHPSTGGLQLLTTSILNLLRQRLSGNGFALLGITMADFYPDPAWNFVFGQADINHRVGVYSFARYEIYRHKPSIDSRKLMLRRSCKVLAHEIGPGRIKACCLGSLVSRTFIGAPIVPGSSSGGELSSFAQRRS